MLVLRNPKIKEFRYLKKIQFKKNQKRINKQTSAAGRGAVWYRKWCLIFDTATRNCVSVSVFFDHFCFQVFEFIALEGKSGFMHLWLPCNLQAVQFSFLTYLMASAVVGTRENISWKHLRHDEDSTKFSSSNWACNQWRTKQNKPK